MKLLSGRRATCAALAMTFAATTAWAAVTFNPADGTGFVGKGDLQLAFGWNNAQAQSLIPYVTYRYEAVAVYTAVCTWTTGEGTRGERTHNVSHKKAIGVTGQVESETRKNNQGHITGVMLLGYQGDAGEIGIPPVVGAPCPGNQGHDGVWSSVSFTSGSTALSAIYNSTPVKIWPPAV